MYNFTPPYLSSLVPPSISNLSRYNLRNSNDLQTIDARTNQYYNSFLPSAVRSWNNLPVEAKESDSVNSFKRFLNQNKTPVPKYYYTGSRTAQILHTRLRTNCSSLNMDPFLKILVILLYAAVEVSKMLNTFSSIAHISKINATNF